MGTDSYSPLITGTIAMLTMAGALIGVYVKANEKILLANQANRYTQKQVDKLEKRVDELENKIFDKLDIMQQSIEELKLIIAKNIH